MKREYIEPCVQAVATICTGQICQTSAKGNSASFESTTSIAGVSWGDDI